MRVIKEVLRELKLFAILNFLNFEENYEIRIHKNFPTACWRWDEKERKHKILIGLGNGLKEKFEKFPEYMKSFGFHEFSHSLHTPRNIESINETLRKKGIPFELYNLFEDARIEHLWRKKFGRKFSWTKVEEEQLKDLMQKIRKTLGNCENYLKEWKEKGFSKVLGTLASDVFFLFVQTEGEEDISKELGKIKPLSELEKDFVETVQSYYKRVIEGNEYSVVEECRKFVEEFGFPTRVLQIIPSPDGNGDMEISDEDFKMLWEDAKDESEGEGESGKGEVGNREYREGEPIIELSSDKVSLDWSSVEREVSKLIKVFRTERKKISSIFPAKKLNTKRLALDEEKVYMREEEKKTRMKPFTVIVDCSGSMEMMTPHQHFLVAVFSELVRRVNTESYLILTKNYEAQLFKLPVGRDVIERIPYDGGSENIYGGIVRFWKYILRTKYVFVISDMVITDYWDNTKVKIQEFGRRGIEVIGIYKGDYYEEARKNARYFFEKFVVCRDTNPIDLLIPILRTLV